MNHYINHMEGEHGWKMHITLDPPVSERTKTIREQQRNPASEVTAVMVSPAPPAKKQDWHDADCAQRFGRDPCDCNYGNRSPTAQGEVKVPADKCVKCGHVGWEFNGVCRWKPGIETEFEDICGCKCEFPAVSDPPVPAERHAFAPYKKTRYCGWPLSYGARCGLTERAGVHLSDDIAGDRAVPFEQSPTAQGEVAAPRPCQADEQVARLEAELEELRDHNICEFCDVNVTAREEMRCCGQCYSKALESIRLAERERIREAIKDLRSKTLWAYKSHEAIGMFLDDVMKAIDGGEG